MEDLSQVDLPENITTERELISQLKQMDEVAISWVWHAYYSKLVRYAYRLTQNASLAEEVVSSVFERFLEYLHRGKGPSENIRSYLYRMTYNAVVDTSRSKIETDPIEESVAEEKSTPEEIAENSDQTTAINNALGSLTEDQRNLILLRFVEGLTMKETAAVMKKSINAIKTMQQRAVKSFRKTPEFQQLAQDYNVET
ncbi:MAG: sigma-70 family RNA polymerase sigma factor [Anaerolineales bacterium]|nr:sigma-70 family RNA polymerase sigma factor [Anaerolineales bacterium]